MQNKLYGLLVLIAIAANLFAPPLFGILLAAIVLFMRLPNMLPQEWRLWVQMPVLAWVAESILFRMDILQPVLVVPTYTRLALWALLASTLCHSTYFLMKKLPLAFVFGVVWGLLIYLTPVLIGQFTSPNMILLSLSAGTIGGLLLLYSFVIQQRIKPV